MSTNPFRRSSLKEVHSSASQSAPDLDGTTSVTLSVDTRVPNPSQKHVNFASPPAIPISPASYPSSPESTRNSLVLSPSHHAWVTPTGHSQALQTDPFQEDPVTEEDDSGIEEALQNARANSEWAVPAGKPTPPSRADAVKDTLNRFASAPRRMTSLHETSHSNPSTKGQRNTLDVDSFKRLLLTGESGLLATNTAPPTVSSNPPQLVSDSSSNTDTASLSQRSILESGHQNVEETPRSSYEIDRGDADTHQDWRLGSGTPHERRPPPPPKPRHGKPISDSTNLPFEQSPLHQPIYHSSPSLEAAELCQTPSRDATPRPEQDDDTELTATKKRPPPPPLARRKSQNKIVDRPGTTRSGPSRYSLNSESDEPASPHPANPSKMAPPPPPTRRTPGGRGPSVDLPSTLEEDDTEDDTASIASSRTPSASKRISQAAIGVAPPLPPPRKYRGSNRSSMDSQRPSLSALGMIPSGRSSSEYGISGSVSDSRNVSGNSNATDILADLATLQREVDSARRSAG